LGNLFSGVKSDANLKSLCGDIISVILKTGCVY